MKFLLLVFSLFLFSYSYAQRQNVYFLKNNGQHVKVRDSADFIRVVKEPDSASTLYNVSEFYQDGKVKLVGKSSRIDPPLFEETCARFYKNGARQSTINYKTGRAVGSEFDFFPNGKLYLVKEYPDNNDIYNDFTYNYLITSYSDSSGKVLVENGNGYFKSYSDDPKEIIEEGNIVNGKRNGTWKGVFGGLKLSFTEEYLNGGLVSGTAVSEEGKSTSYTKSRGNPPQFKGGVSEFGRYLGNNINYPFYAREHNIQGVVILSFVVEKDGNLSDVKVQKSVAPILDEEALRVIKKSPQWIPGTQFGQPVRVVYSVPVSFKLTGT